MTSSRLFIPAALMLVICGCFGRTQESEAEGMLLRIGEQLVLEGRFDEAIPVLKEHLLRYPLDPGAHYYLGQCHLNARDPWLFLAEGELRTALMLFRDHGQPNTVERLDELRFQQSVHVEIAKVFLRQFGIMQQIGAPLEAQRALLGRLQQEADLARALIPDSADLRWLQSEIDRVRTIVEGSPSVPRTDYYEV